MSRRFLTTVTGRSLGDHVCWPFHGMDELVASARAYVGEGLDRHERVMFCKFTPSGMQHAVVSSMADVGRPVGAELPVLAPLTTEPGWTPSTSPLTAWGHMAEAAVADGYTGLRVLTDATDLARDADTRRLWVRREHLIDRHGPHHPLVVMCGYDADYLGEEQLAEVACVHALTGDRPCTFLLRAADGDGGLALSGEVDRGSAVGLYRAVVEIADGTSGPVVLDLSEQEFIDHTGLVALHRAARTLGTTVLLVGASPLTAMLVDAFGLTGVSVAEAS